MAAAILDTKLVGEALAELGVLDHPEYATITPASWRFSSVSNPEQRYALGQLQRHCLSESNRSGIELTRHLATYVEHGYHDDETGPAAVIKRMVSAEAVDWQSAKRFPVLAEFAEALTCILNELVGKVQSLALDAVLTGHITGPEAVRVIEWVQAEADRAGN